MRMKIQLKSEHVESMCNISDISLIHTVIKEKNRGSTIKNVYLLTFYE